MALIELGLAAVTRSLPPRTGRRSGPMNPQNSPALLGGSAGGFQSARIDRLTQDWSTARRSADQELFNGLVRLRARARERALNSPIGAKFLQMLRTNIVGAHSVKLEFKVEKQRKHDENEIYDDATNDKLAKAWRKWCKRKYCTMQGNLSFHDVLLLWCDAIGRDGDFLLRKVLLPKSQNPFGFALQLIDADQLNENMNVVGGPNRPQTRMGVQVDKYQRPLAYWLYDGNPVEFGFGSSDCKLVPAEQVYHSYIPRRVGQSRGYPLLAPVLWDINQLDKYFDAELVAARIGSSLLATIEQEGATDYEGDGENSDGSSAIKLESGTIPILGPNQKLNNQTPQHPTAAFNPFVERSLRLIASGLGVAYHELGNDLAGVNFSSGRLGVQEERDYWMELQRMLIESIIRPVYEDWLKAALLNNAIEDLPFDPDRYSDDDVVQFMPRRWDWVDPLKDTQATIDQVQNGLETREGALRKKGSDWRKVMKQLKVEQDYAEELGLQLGTDIRGDALSEIDSGEPDDTGSPSDPKPPTNDQPAKPAAKPKAKPKGKKG